jgi:hypothetical protein
MRCKNQISFMKQTSRKRTPSLGNQNQAVLATYYQGLRGGGGQQQVEPLL